MPMILGLFGLGRVVADKQGKIPAWLAKITLILFAALWWSYDGFFKKTFGDGDRTESQEDANNGLLYPSEKVALLANMQKGVEFVG